MEFRVFSSLYTRQIWEINFIYLLFIIDSIWCILVHVYVNVWALIKGVNVCISLILETVLGDLAVKELARYT